MLEGRTTRKDLSLLIPQAVRCGLRRVLGCQRPRGEARGLIHFQPPQLISRPYRPSEGKQGRE